MYGLDPSTDVSLLIGCTLDHVGVGRHQVSLALAGNPHPRCSLTIEGDFVVGSRDGTRRTFSDAVEGSGAITPLLSLSVVTADVPENGRLRISFSDGSVIEALDSESDYESYQLSIGERVIIV